MWNTEVLALYVSTGSLPCSPTLFLEFLSCGSVTCHVTLQYFSYFLSCHLSNVGHSIILFSLFCSTSDLLFVYLLVFTSCHSFHWGYSGNPCHAVIVIQKWHSIYFFQSVITIFPFYLAMYVGNYKPVSFPDCKFLGLKNDDLVCW